MVKKSLKYIENKCSYWALQLVLIGKDARHKENIRHVRTWLQGISSNFSCLFRSKTANMEGVFLLCGGFRFLLSMAVDGPIA